MVAEDDDSAEGHPVLLLRFRQDSEDQLVDEAVRRQEEAGLEGLDGDLGQVAGMDLSLGSSHTLLDGERPSRPFTCTDRISGVSVSAASGFGRERSDPVETEPIHPGEVLFEDLLKPLGLSQYRLAQGLKVPPRRINEIVHRKRSITADTALRLSRFFGTSERFWMNLQCRYELEVQRDRLGGLLESEVEVLAEAR